VILRGSRPRCCLYAVYAYLERQGVRFLRPGPDGEVIPRRQRLKVVGHVQEEGSYRHRCVCHEGATSIDHALAMVDWMAKHRMNEFQLQFETSIAFWNRWYDHELNPRYPTDRRTPRHGKISMAKSRALDCMLIKALRRRDLDVHRMGHGWTSASLGITARGWEKSAPEITPDKRKRIAMVGGQREWHQGVPGNTQLCLSNRKAFDGLVETVVRYAKRHPEVDVVLFCLADGMNQHCQCTACGHRSVTDWYAMVVNVIAARLKVLKLKTRVSFDAYVDLLWPPQEQFIDEQSDNLLFMYAPFFRCYEHAFADPRCRCDYPVKAWPRNETPRIVSNRAYVQLLRQWQAHCATDSFLADYHFIRMHYYVMDEWMVMQRVHSDVVDLLRLGIHGFFSCQVLRAFYPTGVAMTVMAKTLWDRTSNLESVVDDYLRAAFGRYGARIKAYLDQIHHGLKPTENGHDHLMYWSRDPGHAVKMVEILDRWEPQLKRMTDRATDPVVLRSLSYLKHYNALMRPLCHAAGSMACGKPDDARVHLEALTDFVACTEQQVHHVMDGWNINLWADERILRWRDGTQWFEKAEEH